MSQLEHALTQRATLVDAVDQLLNRGAVLVGEATLSLAGVDLVYVGLNLLISSVETLQQHRPLQASATPLSAESVRDVTLLPASTTESDRGVPASRPTASMPTPLLSGQCPGSKPVLSPSVGDEAVSEQPEHGLVRLVLTLVELLRQIVERQAIRRMDGQSLSEGDIERMGLALRELESKMSELRSLFGLEEDELAIDLGPLGRLV